MGARYDFGRAGEVRLANGGRVPLRIATADGFRGRFLGLMGMRSLAGGCGLLLKGCTSIHMCFMRFPIDVIWIGETDAQGVAEVLRVDSGVRPWKVAFGPKGARSCIEVASGWTPAGPEGVFIPA